MAFYVQDQSQVSFQYSSGTFATPSGNGGQWIGLVQSHEAEENLNVTPVRYAGTSSRNVGKFVDGGIDVTGKLSFYPQDWKMVQFMLGSVYDAGSPSPYTHSISEINSNVANAYTSGTTNPFIDLNIEDVQQTSNKVTRKFVKGAQVDELSIAWSETDPITCDVSYIAKLVEPDSGTKLAVTEPTLIPFMSDMVQVHLPSGTILNGVREGTITMKNNLKAKHYNTGSKEIQFSIPTSRDYEITLGLDKDSTTVNDDLYQTYFQSGANSTQFNLLIDIKDRTAGAGSRDAQFIFSGCRVHPYSSPTSPEDVVTEDITILPQSCIVKVNDQIQYYKYTSGAE